MNNIIVSNCVVSIHYTLRDGDGYMLDTSINSEPLVYLHGAGNLISGLENVLTGKSAGETFNVIIPPGDAYGDYRQDLVKSVPLSSFKGMEEVKVGMQFETRGTNESEFVIVTEVRETDVVVDANHPHAGKTLHFDITVESIRDATPEEIEHGHPHHEHGHSH